MNPRLCTWTPLLALVACGAPQAEPSRLPPTAEPAQPKEAPPVTKEARLEVTEARWARVAEGPAVLRACAVEAAFDGTYVCYATPGTECGDSTSTVASLGVMLCTGVRTQRWEGTGDVPAESSLCCGVVKGHGGTIVVAYDGR
jgi:gentisate 1,2-dioxygenase